MKEKAASYSRSQRSQGLTEFAIIAPIILLLTFGIIDFGRALYLYITLQQAANEGARVAVRASYFVDPNGNQYGTRGSPPADNSWRLGDINVAILMRFQLITPLIQGLFGSGLNLAYNEHFTIQGKP